MSWISFEFPPKHQKGFTFYALITPDMHTIRRIENTLLRPSPDEKRLDIISQSLPQNLAEMKTENSTRDKYGCFSWLFDHFPFHMWRSRTNANEMGNLQ